MIEDFVKRHDVDPDEAAAVGREVHRFAQAHGIPAHKERFLLEIVGCWAWLSRDLPPRNGGEFLAATTILRNLPLGRVPDD